MQDGSKHTVARRPPQLSACSRGGETARGESRRARQEVGEDLSSGWAGARVEPVLFVDSFLWRKEGQDAKRCDTMQMDVLRCGVLALIMEWNRKVKLSLCGNELSRRQVQLYWRIWGRRGSGCLGCDTRARVPPLSDPRPEDLKWSNVDKIKPNRHLDYCISALSTSRKYPTVLRCTSSLLQYCFLHHRADVFGII